jgi:TPR repeat protein
MQLALLLLHGLGGSTDRAQAHQWTLKAAQQDHEGARCVLDAGLTADPASLSNEPAAKRARIAIAASSKCAAWGLFARYRFDVQVERSAD